MLRFATIGTSTITRHLADAVAAVDGAEINCVYSRDAGRAADFARMLDVPRWASDLAAMLALPTVDAVYVASPNSVHFGQAMAAIRAGKHVLVEKPAVPTAAEWDELVREAAAAGVVVLEAIRTEYDPGLDAVRDALPLLGPIRRVSLRYEKRSARYDLVLAGQAVNMFDPAMAGGALLDLGVYCAHALISLFGPPRAVRAAAVTLPSGVIGAGTALAGYPGFVADLSYSKITTSVLPSEIQGENASLLIDHIASARSLTIAFPDGTTQDRTLADPQHTLVDEVRRFVHLTATDDPADRDHDLTRQTLVLLEEIGHRSVTGQLSE